jgi:L-ascorbate metabolism protein UlaG (beta-lactamase superfamily)
MCRRDSADEWKRPRYFDGKRYFNPTAKQVRGFADLIRWQRSSRPEPSPKFVEDVKPSTPPPRVEGGGLRITMVNHSTLLIQQRGINLLTDPIWSERASPLRWIGPKRHRRPGVAWDDLPEIDMVLISHNHYDHLDLPTLRLLEGRGKPAFLVPMGVGRLLRDERIGPVQEFDWGGRAAVGGCAVHCVPAQHFSGRRLFDRNATLWCGYVIECAGRTVYFAADTGFGEHFVWIREKFGAPDVALLPIGAYEPRWFMSPVHMAPAEAVQAHRILGARTSIAIHHGTFRLTDEALDTPKRALMEAAAGNPSFVVLGNGEFVEQP